MSEISLLILILATKSRNCTIMSLLLDEGVYSLKR